jgi:hypothetical protein
MIRHLLLTLACTASALVLSGLAAAPDSRAQPDETAAPAVRPSPMATGADIAASVPMPILRAEYKARRLVLAGTVPDEAERRALVARARAVYGASQVTDRLVVGAVANPAWLSPAFLPDLRGARHATLLLEDGRLLVEGDAGSEQAQAAMTASLDRLRAQGLEVDNRLRAPAP